jgi:hypothetical protein
MRFGNVAEGLSRWVAARTIMTIMMIAITIRGMGGGRMVARAIANGNGISGRIRVMKMKSIRERGGC